jgi:hypothetical protein
MVDWRWWWLAERAHEGGGDLGPPDKTGGRGSVLTNDARGPLQFDGG